MRTHNLTDESLYPNVHFYTFNRVVNIFTAERIYVGDILTDGERKVEVTKVERDKVCDTHAMRYSIGTKYNVVKFKKVG